MQLKQNQHFKSYKKQDEIHLPYSIHLKSLYILVISHLFLEVWTWIQIPQMRPIYLSLSLSQEDN